MAEFKCGDCGHEDHFSEFKTGSHEVEDQCGEMVEEDETECPECGSENVYEV